MDINRGTVVQLYFQSSLSHERRFHGDQPVKLLHPDYIPTFPAPFPGLCRGTGGGEKAEDRENEGIAIGKAECPPPLPFPGTLGLYSAG